MRCAPPALHVCSKEAARRCSCTPGWDCCMHPTMAAAASLAERRSSASSAADLRHLQQSRTRCQGAGKCNTACRINYCWQNGHLHWRCSLCNGMQQSARVQQ
jgi:hypothetical protein